MIIDVDQSLEKPTILSLKQHSRKHRSNLIKENLDRTDINCKIIINRQNTLHPHTIVDTQIIINKNETV